MGTRKVTKTGKDRDGDITSLCNPGEWWSPRKKADAIKDIRDAGKPYSENSPYYTMVDGKSVAVVVIEDDKIKGDYLRTDRDKTTKNNLAELPDC